MKFNIKGVDLKALLEISERVNVYPVWVDDPFEDDQSIALDGYIKEKYSRNLDLLEAFELVKSEFSGDINITKVEAVCRNTNCFEVIKEVI